METMTRNGLRKGASSSVDTCLFSVNIENIVLHPHTLPQCLSWNLNRYLPTEDFKVFAHGFLSTKYFERCTL